MFAFKYLSMNLSADTFSNIATSPLFVPLHLSKNFKCVYLFSFISILSSIYTSWALPNCIFLCRPPPTTHVAERELILISGLINLAGFIIGVHDLNSRRNTAKSHRQGRKRKSEEKTIRWKIQNIESSAKERANPKFSQVLGTSESNMYKHLPSL